MDLSRDAQFLDPAPGNYVSDVDEWLDVFGRKHVDREDNADGIYLLQDNTDTIHTFFSAPGKDSANMMRQFLATHLPKESVIDEYGCVVPIADVSGDHLPKLQAQLWLIETEKSGRSPLSLLKGDAKTNQRAPAVQRRFNTARSSPAKTAATEDLLRIACHVTFITELLQVNHIFVSSKKASGVCELSFCPSRAVAASRPSPVITIEPLIHWGTVSPAAELSSCLSRIQVFRRDGEKCDDPLWTQAITKLTPQHPTSYCLDCLWMMMEKRTAALQAIHRQKPGSFTAVNQPPASRPQDRHFEPSRGLEVQQQWFPYTGSNTDEEEDDEEDFYSGPPDASLNLDGASDSRKKSKIVPLRPGRNKYGFPILANPLRDRENMSNFDSSDSHIPEVDYSALQRARQRSCFSILIDSRDWDAGDNDNHGPKAESFSSSRNDLKSRENSFTPTPIVSNHDSVKSLWTTANLPTSTLSTQQSDRTHHCPKTQLHPVGQSQPSHQIRPLSSAQSIRRTFGCELDTNIPSNTTKLPAKPGLKMEARKTSTTAKVDVRNFLAKALKGPSGQISTSRDLDDSPSSPEHTSSESWETTASSDETLPYDDDDDTPPKAPPPTRTPSPSPPPLRPIPKPAARKVTPPPSPKRHFFAKFPPLPRSSPISAPTQQAHQALIPSPTSTICTCRRPPSPGSALAQCTNPACVFVWLHYSCLDKAGKLSARHGRLVCQHCRNATFFAEKDDVEALVAREVEWDVSGEEIVANLPGLGGERGVVDPYGIGSMVRAREEVRKKDADDVDGGALGALGFMGYVESRPGMVGETYLEPGRYVERVRRMAEEVEREEEWGEEEDDYEYYEEYEYEYEEGYEDEEGEVDEECDAENGEAEDDDEDEEDREETDVDE